MAPETSKKDPEFVKLVENPPGGPLRQARQALNFGQLDVARRMNLSVEVINALEENKFSDLPEATYVKGYLRSYARFLEIDSDPLINAYEELIQPEHGSAASSSATSDRVHRATVRWAPLAIAGVLLVMFASWWVNVQPPTPEATKRVESQSPQVKETESIEPEATLAEASEVTPETASVAAVTDEDAMPTPTAAEDEQTITEPEEAIGITETPSLQTESTATPEPAVEATPSTATPEPAVEATPTAVTGEPVSDSSAGTTPGKDQLTIVFSAQSWTEVYDAAEQRLLFDLVKSGSVRNLQGTAPFNVRLGNSSGVQISINGRPFNHSQFSRQDNTARFSVDRPSLD